MGSEDYIPQGLSSDVTAEEWSLLRGRQPISVYDTLTIENGRDRIAIYGNLDITCDKAGLTIARQLANYLAKIVGVLQADPRLPEKLQPPGALKRVPNPFD